jgi:hypothetical protein
MATVRGKPVVNFNAKVSIHLKIRFLHLFKTQCAQYTIAQNERAMAISNTYTQM